MQHAQAALLLMLAYTLTLSTHCVETSGVRHGQRSTTAAAGPTTDATSWLSGQGDCSAYYNSRRTLTKEEQRLIAARTFIHDSSCSQRSGLGGLHSSSSTGDRPDSSWCPALLWTYTGTGNTMTRMLIEAASGWYTGSVYTDLSLVGILPGECFCDSRVLAVKAHPQWHSFASLSPEGFRPDTPHVPPDAKDICPCAYNRAVAVIRDPYATFLAEYKRLRTHDYDSCSEGLSDGKECTGGHVSVIHKADFNATDFRLEVMRMAKEWAAMFDSYEAFAAANPGGFYLTTFENLTNPSTRMQALVDVLQFVGVPPDAVQSLQHTCTADSAGCTAAAANIDAAQEPAQATGRFQPNMESHSHSPSADRPVGGTTGTAPGGLQGYNEGRLKCAFQLAQHPSIYRPKAKQSIDAQYVYGGDSALVCDVWAVVGAKAAAHGYVPYANIQC